MLIGEALMATLSRNPVVRNSREINALQPKDREYRATVDGIDCLYVKVSPNGTKRFVTSVTVSKRIKLPEGASRQKSETHGLTTQFTLPEIKRLHFKYYESFKRGEDPREDEIRTQIELERTSLLHKPIVDLSRERIARGLKQDRLTKGSAYNDEFYTGKLEEVIGKISFLEFTQHHADQLSDAYPPKTQRSTAEKIKKLVTKVYNSLPSDARHTLYKDIPHYLETAFGRIKTKTRNDQTIEPENIGELWFKMLNADVNPIFKDVFVFLLLTAERKNATLKVQLKNLERKNGAPEFLYLDTKRDNTGEGMNLIHPVGMFALLLDRLRSNSDSEATYLFPSQKGKGYLTDISPLIDAIGGVGESSVRANPHNLRRTTANLGRVVLGSTQLADEHILHFKSHMSGSSESYFADKAKSFAKVRSGTFRKVYSYLDDLILSSGTHNYFGPGDDEADSIDKLQADNPDKLICRDFISLDSEILSFCNKDRPGEIGFFKSDEDFLQNAFIRSPLASFCAGKNKYVCLRDRPLLQHTVKLGWANFGNQILRDLDNEIS